MNCCHCSLTFSFVDGHLLMQWWFSIVGVERDNHPACHTHLLSLGPPLEEDIWLLPNLMHSALNCECHLLERLRSEFGTLLMPHEIRKCVVISVPG